MKYAVLLLALMFVGVATPSMAQKPKPKGQVPQKLTFEFEGKTIEVAKEDFTKQMNWFDAKKACKNLGSGWRLPSIDELRAMYEQLYLKGKGNFQSTWYWSSSERGAYSAWDFSFEFGEAGNSYENGTGHVRAVRTLPSHPQELQSPKGQSIGSGILLFLSLIFLFAIIGKFKKQKEKNSNNPSNEKSDSNVEKTSINRPNYFQLAKKMQLLPYGAKSVSNGEIWPNIPKIGKYDGLIGMFLLVIHYEKKANTSHCQRIIKIQYERAYDIMQQLVELGFISQTGTKDYRINFSDFNKVLNKLENLKN